MIAPKDIYLVKTIKYIAGKWLCRFSFDYMMKGFNTDF